MYRFLFLTFLILFVASAASAQQETDTAEQLPVDTVSLVDSTLPAVIDSIPEIVYSDSVSKRPLNLQSSWQIMDDIPLSQQILQHHPYINFGGKPVVFRSDLRKVNGKEIMFYSLVTLLLFFALLKISFAKYLNDLFRVFFRTTLKQRQIRDQLMQTPIPSLAFNLFFVASTGLYIDFLFQYFEFRPVENFWLLYLYCCLGLVIIYLGKFIGLKLSGWLFNMKSAADSYIFIVFIINKVIGIFLLPFIIILGFTSDPIYSIALVISWAGIAVLLLYRFILGYAAVRNEVKFNLFHFFLYLCAFEVAPLILIYRLLLLVF